ncbi:MAG: hypothetical protein GXO63_00335 [Candidatus Micrarchaeota archaeon]|nr:hypothetical protein [Candidatus Micrarchaeota archaeon]
MYRQKGRLLSVLSGRNRVTVRFWPFSLSFKTSEIEDVRVLGKIPWYVGWGLRINPFKKRVYFVTNHKNCVLIKKRNGFWKEVVVSVRDPEKFVSEVS